MTLKQFAALSDLDCKILLYFLLVVQGEFQFNLANLRDYTDLSNIEIFKRLKLLSDLEIIDFIEEASKGTIFLKVFEATVNLQIPNWSIQSIVNLNEYVFENSPTVLHSLVNEIYSPLGLFDHETMAKYIDPDFVPILNSVSEISDIINVNKKTEKLKRAQDRRALEKRAKELVDIFYEILNESMKVYVTDQLFKTELHNGVEFLKRYPEYPKDLIIGAIRWFRNDVFWNRIVTNISSFNKHFPKYLVENKGIKKVNREIKLI